MRLTKTAAAIRDALQKMFPGGQVSVVEVHPDAVVWVKVVDESFESIAEDDRDTLVEEKLRPLQRKTNVFNALHWMSLRTPTEDKHALALHEAARTLGLDPRRAAVMLRQDCDMLDKGPPRAADYKINVNGSARTLHTGHVTYQEIVDIACEVNDRKQPTVLHSVMFSKGPITKPEGCLMRGQKVMLVDGMQFSAYITDNA